jgi:hypothetical protein
MLVSITSNLCSGIEALILVESFLAPSMVRARDSQPPDSSHLYSQFRPRMTLKWQTAQSQQRVTRQSTIAAKCIIQEIPAPRSVLCCALAGRLSSCSGRYYHGSLCQSILQHLHR